jgi:hypothetical protein
MTVWKVSNASSKSQIFFPQGLVVIVEPLAFATLYLMPFQGLIVNFLSISFNLSENLFKGNSFYPLWWISFTQVVKFKMPDQDALRKSLHNYNASRSEAQ